MANDKDFVVAGAVEVGKDTKVTLGSITSSDIDLATGNYFDDTLAANTTYTISNAGDVQAFQLEVTGGVVGYGAIDATYDDRVKDVGAQESTPTGLFFKPDGLAMYIVGNSSYRVYQYTLSTAWDAQSASYASKSFSFGSQGIAIQDIYMKPDGTKMYIAINSSNDNIYQYSLGTAWDVSTASYDNKSFYIGSQQTAIYGVTLKPDGTKMYIVGDNGDNVDEYALSTAWDVSTASYTSSGASGTALLNPSSIRFSDDGTKAFITDQASSAINVNQYSLSTAWDTSTMSLDGSLSISSVSAAPYGLAFGDSGKKMYVVDSGDRVRQWSSLAPALITWPSSIEWAGGVAPAAPADGETDVFTLVTDDGGTSYVGVKTADNLS